MKRPPKAGTPIPKPQPRIVVLAVQIAGVEDGISKLITQRSRAQVALDQVTGELVQARQGLAALRREMDKHTASPAVRT